tara:strand:- start:76 stop:183 length:108 start_codon:yes stop_codon:yes gene_type:complete
MIDKIQFLIAKLWLQTIGANLPAPKWMRKKYGFPG